MDEEGNVVVTTRVLRFRNHLPIFTSLNSRLLYDSSITTARFRGLGSLKLEPLTSSFIDDIDDDSYELSARENISPPRLLLFDCLAVTDKDSQLSVWSTEIDSTYRFPFRFASAMRKRTGIIHFLPRDYVFVPPSES